MSETQILNWLKFDIIRKIFKACMEVPKSAKEIEKLTGSNSTEIAEDLEILERHQAIRFSEGKWKATELGIKAYQKYFG